MNASKRIGFLGISGHTLSTHRALLNKLAEKFTIIVYSEVMVQPSWLRPYHRYSVRCFPGMGLPTHVRAFIFLVMLIKEHLKRPFDLIHAHSTYPAGFAAVILQKLFRIPALVCFDGEEGIFIPEAQFGDGNSRKRIALNKWIINNARLVVTLTFFQRELVCKNLNCKNELKVITRGVDNNVFTSSPRDKINSPIIFLNVGYFSPIKDPTTLLTTFFLLQKQLDCQLIHIGKDYMNGAVQQMARELGIAEKVSFIEKIEHERMHEYYRKADVLLHTALFESQAMVVTEAMACGTLVCGTSVGLMSDLSGTCCITAPPKNAEALASAIFNLLNNEAEMNRIRVNAYTWSKTHSLDECAHEFEGVYAQLIQS